MKLTRKHLKNLILEEVKLMREGSVKNLIVELAEIIEQHMIESGRNQISLRAAIRLLQVQHPTAAEFPPNELQEFVRDSLIEGDMDFVDLELDVMTTRTGREIELVTRQIYDDEDLELF